MPNMSYCRFQNTLPDLRDCQEALDDIGGDIDEIDSEEEKRAAKRLIQTCIEIARDYGDGDDE